MCTGEINILLSQVVIKICKSAQSILFKTTPVKITDSLKFNIKILNCLFIIKGIPTCKTQKY